MEPITTPEIAVESQAPPQPRGIAPVWHTLLFIALFGGLALGGRVQANAPVTQARWPLYLETIVMQWLLVLYVWWGLRMRGRKMRDLIGGRWDTVEAVVTDVVIAIGFFLANLAVRAIVLGAILSRNAGLKKSMMEGVQHVAKVIGPQSRWDLLMFMGVVITAGICEEIMFRGYLQQQLGIWTRNTALGVILSALLFCVGHSYQGWFLAAQVGLLGLMLGILAAWRKSLRPGILAHGIQDIISGLLSKLLFSGAH